MAWRVQSRLEVGLWVDRTDSGWDADPDSRDRVNALKDGPLTLTPVGPYYDPTGPDDDVALFIAALSAVPAPQVFGNPPDVPKIPAEAQDGTVY